MKHETDREGRPILRDVRQHIGTLDRRKDYLLEQIGGNGRRPMSETAKRFAREEVAALRTAVVGLEYHQGVIGRMDEPIGLLREVVEAYEGPVDQEGRMRAVVKRAKLLLEEFDR